MPATYEPIATATINTAANYTFTSIPNTYTDLRLIYVNTATSGNNNLYVRVNGDTGTNYSCTRLQGNGTSVSSNRQTSSTAIVLDDVYFMSQSVPSFFALDFLSYAGSTNKTFLWEVNEDYNGAGGVARGVGLWRNTAAITSITLLPSSGTFTGTATLYGIKAA